MKRPLGASLKVEVGQRAVVGVSVKVVWAFCATKTKVQAGLKAVRLEVLQRQNVLMDQVKKKNLDVRDQTAAVRK